jgi:L-threonylcarbamoyladenylate synthase
MIVPATPENIARGAKLIEQGGLVAFPTETVYGLGGNAFDAEAVARIFEAKQRPSFDPLITHIADLAMLDRIADVRDDRVLQAAERFWPGALTLVVPKRTCIPDLATSGLPTMAVRMPAHPVALSLIRGSTGAVAAPSANPFGFLSPTTAGHVEAQLGDRVDLILDGGACPVGVESTVLDLTGKTPTILRPGGIPAEALGEAFGEVAVLDRKVASPTAPGQLPMHYAPRKPLQVVDSPADVSNRSRAGALVFGDVAADGFRAVRNLSPEANPVKAASNLFAMLHELDCEPDVDVIYAMRIPEEGIGVAVMDRIYKASQK